MAYTANRPKKKPFRVEKTQMINGVPHGGRITYGHNPHIYARMVCNLTISEEGEFEIVTWQEPDNYCWKDKKAMKIVIDRSGNIKSLKRLCEHSLSCEMDAL